MKKAFIILLGLSSFSIANAGRDIITQNVNELPEKARTTLKEQFSNEEVSFIKIDRDFIRKSYEVQFVSGNEVAFNNKGEWTEIEFDKSSVPASFIPSDIQKLVDSMFKGQQIRKIEKDMYGHEIELSDGRDLKFDKKNRLFKMDD
jgi:hypothetical protein